VTSIELFGTVFGVIFLAELPDKTALAALVLATRHKPLPVFLGTGLALTLQSIIAVAAGSLLAKLPNNYVQIGAGVLFLVFAIVMWVRKEEAEEATEDKGGGGFWKPLRTTLIVVFLAEWGDLTQLGTATFQAKYNSWLVIMIASALALWCVSAIAVFIGNRAGKLLDPNITQKVAAVVFAGVGIFMIVNALR
jgi:putative Ca2+/H+ antiporter (TMEM165/GDT1 family)